MDLETCSYYLQLLGSKKIPVPTISRLLREYGSAKTILNLSRVKLQELGFVDRQIELLQSRPEESNFEISTKRALDWAEEDQNHLVCYESRNYPTLLREIDSAPPILFIKGSLAALEGKHFALVGSRRATLYGKKNAYWLALQLSRAGFQICSGMAAGIDSRAHEGALDCGGTTVAVIGTGIDLIYPKGNASLAARIAENGALVSEFPLGTPPYSSNFPRRNRIISGMACGTLVVEANLKSGSLITARLAMEQNRDVFAVPGPIASPQSRGCHNLIRQGAKLVENPEDILEEFGLTGQCLATQDEAQQATVGQVIDPAREPAALVAIGHEGCLFQAIQAQCKLDIQELNGQLIRLEAAGLIRQEGGRYFRLD